MADYEFLKYETDPDGITTVTLNRPPANAFNRAMGEELISALEKFADEEKERILMLTGAGRFFSAGEDLGNISLDWTDEQIADYAEETLLQYHEIILYILDIGKPIIAALNGVAAGAGLSIALACDYRIAPYTDEGKHIIPAFADMGLIPDSGMILTLPRLVGRGNQPHVWLYEQGIAFSFQEAFGEGLLDRIFYTGADDEAKADLIKVLARKLSKGSPLAFAFTKAMQNKSLLRELNEEVFPWEIRAQTACLQSEYFKQKARKFLAKRS